MKVSRPVGSKNLPKVKPVVKKVVPKKPEPKKKQVKEEKLPKPPKVEKIKEEKPEKPIPVPADPADQMRVRFMDWQFFEKVTPECVAMSIKKKGVEITLSANEAEQLLKLEVYPATKDALDKKIRARTVVFKFEEFLTFINMMSGYETTDIREKKVKGKF